MVIDGKHGDSLNTHLNLTSIETKVSRDSEKLGCQRTTGTRSVRKLKIGI